MTRKALLRYFKSHKNAFFFFFKKSVIMSLKRHYKPICLQLQEDVIQRFFVLLRLLKKSVT